MASVHLTHRREVTNRTGQEDVNKEEEIEVMWPQPQKPANADSHQDQEERRGSPLENSGTLALMAPWFQSSGLHNCERTNACCLKPTR